MTPTVSVVLPAWNAAGHIDRAISSTLTQTFSDWELLVVDDGSTDNTVDAVHTAARGDSRVHVLPLRRGGIVSALNAGIAAARGRFIARMDADDEMKPARLAEQVALLEARPDIGVASCLVEFGGDPVAARGYALHVAWINSLVEPDAIALHRFVEAPLAHPSVMFRRELIARHGGYQAGDFPEDYELWLRWLDAGVRFAKVPQALLRWNDPPDRLSRTHANYAIEAFYDCKCRYLARWIQREVSPARSIFLWGAGRITRQRFRALETHGVALAGFIDVDAKKTGRTIAGRPVLRPEELPSPDVCFVVAGVASRGARELITSALQARGFVAGRDYVLAA